MAASSTTDFIFVASVTTIRGYRLVRDRDFEHGRINDQHGSHGQSSNTPSQCLLDKILDGEPDITLGCRFTGLAITCIKCGVAKVDGILQEYLVAVCEDGMVNAWRLSDSIEEMLAHGPLVIEY